MLILRIFLEFVFRSVNILLFWKRCEGEAVQMQKNHDVLKLKIVLLTVLFLCVGGRCAESEDLIQPKPGQVRVSFYIKGIEVCSATYDVTGQKFCGQYYEEDAGQSRQYIVQPLESVFSDRLLMGYALKKDVHQHAKIHQATLRLADATLERYDPCFFTSEVLGELLKNVLPQLTPCSGSEVTAMESALRAFPDQQVVQWSVAPMKRVDLDVNSHHYLVVVGQEGVLKAEARPRTAKVVSAARSLLFAKMQGAKDAILLEYKGTAKERSQCVGTIGRFDQDRIIESIPETV